MNWATLPEGCPEIFERIVRLSTDEPELICWNVNLNERLNARMIRIRSIGQVCSQWKEAILASSTLFKSIDELTVWWQNSPPQIAGDQADYRGDAEELIEDGYMRVTKKLVIDEISLGNVDLLCNADDNQIEEFVFRDNCLGNACKWLRKMIRLFGMSKKAYKFTFQLSIGHLSEAELLWQLLRAAVDCNERPKEIIYEVSDDNLNDWDFTKYTTSTNVGSIKQLTISKYDDMPPNFSCLGKIDSISARNIRSFKESDGGSVNKLFELLLKYPEVQTKYVSIGTRMGPFMVTGLGLDINSIFERARVETFGFRAPSAKSLTFTVHVDHCSYMDSPYNDLFRKFTATFECEADLWKRVREWLTDVEGQCVQLIVIDEKNMDGYY